MYLTAAKQCWELMGGLCTHLPPQQEEAHIAASASVVNYSQWFPSFRVSADNRTIRRMAFVPMEPISLSVSGHQWQLMWVQRRSEKPAGLELARGSSYGPTRVVYFHGVQARSEGWHFHRLGSHKIGVFYLKVLQLHFPKYWSAVAGSTLQKYQHSRKPWLSVGLPNRPTRLALAALCRIVTSFSTARFITQGSDPIKSEGLFCMLPYVIIFYKKESKCQAKGRKKTNINHLNRE